MGKQLKSGVFGILILVVGIIVGVILVRQTQSFKNKAKEQMGKNYIVCHKTEDSESPWKEIMVDAEELPSYLNTGDIFGRCPDSISN